MEKNWKFSFNEQETNIIKQVNDIFKYSFPENDLLEYTLLNIKIQGGAYLIDIMNISSLGIPIFTMLASKRKQSLAELVNHLKSGSVNFYDCKDVLIKFLLP